MDDLISKLEHAKWPDRLLGFEVLAACGWRKTCIGYFHGPLYQWSGPNGQGCDEDRLPCPTRSLDAALTLMPEGWTRAVDATVPGDGIDVDLFPEGAGMVRGSHSIEAIATCIAVLKARSALLAKDT